MPNLDCAHFFFFFCPCDPKIKLLYTVSLIFLLQHSMTDCQGEFLSSIQVTLILLSMVANGNWRPSLSHVSQTPSSPDCKLMSDSAVLCFCQFIACFLSHMPVKFAIHVNLSNSRKPTRSLKPIYQNTCSMLTSEVARETSADRQSNKVKFNKQFNPQNEIISRSNHMNLTL